MGDTVANVVVYELRRSSLHCHTVVVAACQCLVVRVSVGCMSLCLALVWIHARGLCYLVGVHWSPSVPFWVSFSDLLLPVPLPPRLFVIHTCQTSTCGSEYLGTALENVRVMLSGGGTCGLQFSLHSLQGWATLLPSYSFQTSSKTVRCCVSQQIALNSLLQARHYLSLIHI